MKCIVIDDEPMAIEILEAYCRKTPSLQLQNTFEDALAALTWLEQHPVDLVFLDINMPDLSGIQFVKALSDPPMIIFTTAYPQHAVTGFELDAVDYLLKPIAFDRFLKAVNKARIRGESGQQTPPHQVSPAPSDGESAREPNYIFVKSGRKHVRVEVDDILYISSEKNYVNLVTGTGRIMALLSMDAVLEMLPAGRFARVHKSYIVAPRHVDVVEQHSLKIGDTEIPIGDAWRKSFFQQIGR